MVDGKTLTFVLLGRDEASPAFKKLASSADETSKSLGSFAKGSGKLFAGFGAGVLASGAAITGGFAAVGVATAATAAVILHNNDKISSAASSLWADLKQQAQQGAAPLAQPIADSLNKLHGTVIALGPDIQQLFAGAGPAIEHLTGGVDKLVRGAMPGLVTAAKNDEAAFAGLESALGDVGQGIGDFFTNASKGAESSGKIIESTGRIIRDFAGFSGSLFAGLSNSGAPAIQTLEGFMSKLESTVLALGSGAFPVLSSSASGFLAVGSGILNIISGISPLLGPLIGQVSTFAIVLKGVDKITFGGVGRAWAVFSDGVGKAEGVAGKAKAALTGLGSGLGLFGIAAGLATAGLELLGQKSQETTKRQQALADAFRQSKGAIDDNVRATVAKSLADEGLLSKAKAIGLSADTATDAWLGNADAAALVTARTAEAERAGTSYTNAGKSGTIATLNDSAQAAHDLSFAFKDQGSEATNAAKAGKLYAEAMGKGAGSAQGLAEANRKAADALKALQEQMDAMVNKDLAYRNAVDATKGAQEALAKAQKDAADALKGHGAKSQEYAAALKGVDDASRGVEGAYISQASAARDLAIANSTATDEVTRAREGSFAYTQEVLNMAQAAGVHAPRALQQMVEHLSATDLQAMGAKKTVNELGQTVITLPNGKTITVNAEDHATSVIRAIAGGRYTATIRLQADWAGFSRTIGQGSVLSNSSAFGNAEGGWITGAGTGTSDSIPRMLSNGEFVIRASEAAKYGPMLEAINSGRGPRASGFAGGPVVSGGGNGRVTVDNRIILDSREMSRFVVASVQKHVSDLGGDTQKALGGRNR